jgi:hypothetical protein
MKESNKKPFFNCDDIEQLLIKKSIDGLCEDESHFIQEHLKSCGRCKNFQDALLNLQDSMQVGRIDKLAPDPAIREKVIQRIKSLKHQEADIPGKTYKAIRSILEYRIPVYRALPVVVLLILMFLAVKQFPSGFRHEPAGVHSIAETGISVPTQLRVIDNLGIIDQQKIGQSVKDDTTLARFIVGTI